MGYARGTSVPVERSQVELERLLAQHGATQFFRATTEDKAFVGFKLAGRFVKVSVPTPTNEDVAHVRKSARADRKAQLQRERWRALQLSVKAKLVGIEAGVETFEEAFLAHIVTADGQTVHQHVAPKLAESYQTGKVQSLMLGAGENRS